MYIVFAFITGDPSTNLDAILGALCDLESQLTTQQSEINSSLRKSDGFKAIPVAHDPENQKPHPPPASRKPQTSHISISSHPSLESDACHQDSDFSALDDQLQSALSELSDFVGESFMEPQGNEFIHSNRLSTTTSGSSGNEDSASQVPSDSHPYDDRHPSPDRSPETTETDSAYSDSTSLPSSESHVSVATNSSQKSQNSQSSSSGGNSGGGGSAGIISSQPSASPVGTLSCMMCCTFASSLLSLIFNRERDFLINYCSLL